MAKAVHGCRVDGAALAATAPPVVSVAVSEQAGEAVLGVDAIGALVRPRRRLVGRGGHTLALDASPALPLAVAVPTRLRWAQDEVAVLMQLRRHAEAPREVAAARVGVEAAAPAAGAAVGDGRRAEVLGAEAAGEAGAGVAAEGEAVLRVAQVAFERSGAAVAGLVEDDGTAAGLRAAVGWRAELDLELAHPAVGRRGMLVVVADAPEARAVLRMGGVATGDGSPHD